MTRIEKPSTRAIILSAGQGRRLLPLTEDRPKCLLPVAGRSMLEWQVDNLLSAGIQEVVVITGFASDLVEACLEGRYGGRNRVRTLYNPFYHVSDNLVSCWMAREHMETDFILLNGDTVFEPALLERVLSSQTAPVTLSVDHKNTYDDDDMKVQLDADGDLVRHVSKTIPAQDIHAESIGLVYFRDDGPALFRQAVESTLRHPAGIRSWYLTVIDALAERQIVRACSIDGYRWAEIDFVEDLARAESLFTETGNDNQAPLYDELRHSTV